MECLLTLRWRIHRLLFEGCRIAVFNRPWNIWEELPDERFIRCEGWKEVDKVFEIKEAMNT